MTDNVTSYPKGDAKVQELVFSFSGFASAASGPVTSRGGEWAREYAAQRLVKAE